MLALLDVMLNGSARGENSMRAPPVRTVHA
jgi:hypothetical protein